jgi:hypothetical protein
MLLLGLAMYSILLVASGIEWVEMKAKHDPVNSSFSNGGLMCVTIEEWFFIMEWVMLGDIIISILIPFLVILLTNVFISMRLLNIAHSIRRSLHRHSSEAANVSTMRGGGTAGGEVSHTMSVFANAGTSMLLKRRRSYKRTTRMLLIISTTFLVLNTPLVMSKMRYLFLNSTASNLNVDSDLSTHSDSRQKYLSTAREKIFEHVTCNLFHLNFAVNFILYTPGRFKWRRFFSTRRAASSNHSTI